MFTHNVKFFQKAMVFHPDQPRFLALKAPSMIHQRRGSGTFPAAASILASYTWLHWHAKYGKRRVSPLSSHACLR